jgi:molybdate transport system substrate-binding protein
LRHTLLAAKSIAYSKESASGIHFAVVLKRLEIAEEMGPKTRLLSTGGRVADLVAKGEVELGVQLISEIFHVPGVALLGPQPAPIRAGLVDQIRGGLPELQTFTVLTAALGVDAKAADAGKALIKLLTAPGRRTCRESQEYGTLTGRSFDRTDSFCITKGGRE